jgi:hypothetical protein
LRDGGETDFAPFFNPESKVKVHCLKNRVYRHLKQKMEGGVRCHFQVYN